MAGTIAGIGLATNNAVMIVASMLVSPLMGPIVAFTFASVIYEKELFWLGIKGEVHGLCSVHLIDCVCTMQLIGILITFAVGILVGLFCGLFWDAEELA